MTDLRRILLDAMKARITDEQDRFSHLVDIATADPEELEQMVDENMFNVVGLIHERLKPLRKAALKSIPRNKNRGGISGSIARMFRERFTNLEMMRIYLRWYEVEGNLRTCFHPATDRIFPIHLLECSIRLQLGMPVT